MTTITWLWSGRQLPLIDWWAYSFIADMIHSAMAVRGGSRSRARAGNQKGDFSSEIVCTRFRPFHGAVDLESKTTPKGRR